MMPRGRTIRAILRICSVASPRLVASIMASDRCDYSYRKQDTVPADDEYSQV